MNEIQLKELVNELIELPSETEWIEFKVNNLEPEKIGETISALSNSASLHEKEKAYLIFGIEDKTHRIVGTKYKPSETKIGNQPIMLWLNQMLNPKIDFRINSLIFEGKDLIIFEIPAARSGTVKFKNIAYIRIGEANQKLNDYPEKEKRIWLKGEDKKFEKEIALENQTEDQVLTLIDYPSLFDLLKKPLPRNKEGILQKLLEEKLISKHKGYYNILNLGAILFAKNINDFDLLSRKSVRVITYDGKNRIKTKWEQVGVKGYASGFSGLISYIQSQLPRNEVISNALRKEVEMYPEIAIRELVANAIIHQDLSITGVSPMIEIFSDRIEITNPGKPLIPTQRFIDYPPRSRNERLARFMRRLNICEERGSGIDKVISIIEMYQLPAPDFYEEKDSTKVILFSHKLLKHMNRNDKIRACYQHCCLKYVSNEQMSNQTLRERFKVSEKNYSIISRIISDTIQSGLIKQSDPENKSKRFASYVPFWA